MRRNNIKYYFPILIFILVVNLALMPFDEMVLQEKTKVTEIFRKIETGIEKGDISSLSDYFSDKTFLSLRNSANGYYSINQMHYVLKDYFAINNPVSFRFNSVISNSESPYATGLFVYNKRGKRDSAVIYLSLKKDQETWKISQLSIN